MALAEGKPTTDPVLSHILFARRVNHYLGVQMWPGEVDELSEDFIDAINGLVEGLPKVQAHQQEVESYLAKWRNSHPTYGKRRG
jgi:hypothetical protein